MKSNVFCNILFASDDDAITMTNLPSMSNNEVICQESFAKCGPWHVSRAQVEKAPGKMLDTANETSNSNE